MKNEMMEKLVSLSVESNDFEVLYDGKMYLVELELSLEENYDENDLKDFFSKDVYKLIKYDTLEYNGETYERELIYYIREK